MLLTGDPDGIPPWLGAVQASDDVGMFMPNEAPWIIHADMATLVGGIRALLMQALHPGSLTGVAEHSRYKGDPLGRLSGTIRWLTVTTFASTKSVGEEAGRVNRMHTRVKGTYVDRNGVRREYQAADPHLLRWVHIAFMDSFLRCHQTFSKREIPGGADEYIRLWAQSVAPLGLDDPPVNESDMLTTLDKYRSELVVTEQTREVIHWIANPPLPFTSIPAYNLFFQSALASLPSDYRDMIGLGDPPLHIYQPATTKLLQFIRFAIGPESPIEEAALARLQRAGALESSAKTGLPT